jgi:hypothetical protein
MPIIFANIVVDFPQWNMTVIEHMMRRSWIIAYFSLLLDFPLQWPLILQDARPKRRCESLARCSHVGNLGTDAIEAI